MIWYDAIAKYVYPVLVACKISGEREFPPPGWTKSSGHLIFDLKMDFIMKSMWVKYGNRTQDPETSSYDGVFSRYSMRVSLMTTALKGVNVLAAGIQNSYFQFP